MNINVHPIVQNVVRNKNRIIKLLNLNVKIIVSAKTIIVGIQAYVLMRIVNT